ncbi:MAG: hypothetical protein ACEPOV_02175 [Hyphomicrobiales bacterium]
MFENYTIELHLEKICTTYPNFKVLYSIWKLNKDHLPDALDTITNNFPHYSKHGASHSRAIVKSIEGVLGKEGIEKLSPTDSFLILMSAYLHDIGMVVLHQFIAEEWKGGQLIQFCEDIIKESSDNGLKDAAKLILNYNKKLLGEKVDDSFKIEELWSLDIKNAMILITADYFRRGHAQRSKEYITASSDHIFQKLMNQFNLNFLPDRFSKMIAEIVAAHGYDYDKLLSNLQYKQSGYDNDLCHPRFIAAMLRLGDLLDADDKRFNPFQIATLNTIPDTSVAHEGKHASVEHILICPDSIEITWNCPSDLIFREAMNWRELILKERTELKDYWKNDIAPFDLKGTCPNIRKDKIVVKFKGVDADSELQNLRFDIPQKKIFEMLEGGAIYDEPDKVFLREIVQNALDATKLQLWYDIKDNRYNSIIQKYLLMEKKEGEQERIEYLQKELDEGKELYQLITFPEDIPQEVYDNYPIKFHIDYKNKGEKGEGILIQLEDRGHGISTETLKRMIFKVGESRRKDKDFQDIKSELPYFLQPTGDFGVGLQSIFLVANEFKIQTKTEKEKAKEIVFKSASKGEYSSITENVPNMERGTRIEILLKPDEYKEKTGDELISKKTLTEVLPEDNDVLYSFFGLKRRYSELVDHVKFPKKGVDPETFLYHQEYDINDELIYSGFFGSDFRNKYEIYIKKEQRTGGRDLYTFRIKIEETEFFGSKVSIFIMEKHNEYGDLRLRLKGVSVFKQSGGRGYENLLHQSVTWDLYNCDSGKIVKLSRDNSIKRKEQELVNEVLIKKIFSRVFESISGVIDKISDAFCSKYSNDKENVSPKSYLAYFRLISLILRYCNNQSLKGSLTKDEINNIKLPILLNKKDSGFDISLKELFSSEEVICVDLVNNSLLKKYLKIKDIEYSGEIDLYKYPINEVFNSFLNEEENQGKIITRDFLLLKDFLTNGFYIEDFYEFLMKDMTIEDNIPIGNCYRAVKFKLKPTSDFDIPRIFFQKNLSDFREEYNHRYFYIPAFGKYYNHISILESSNPLGLMNDLSFNLRLIVFFRSAGIIFLDAFDKFKDLELNIKDKIEIEKRKERIRAFIETEITDELAEYIIENAPKDITEERTAKKIRNKYAILLEDYINSIEEKKTTTEEKQEVES